MDKEPREVTEEAVNPFRNLAYFLERGVSVATLATAIKKDGIYATDEHGCFGIAGESDQNNALQYLASYRKSIMDIDEVTGHPNQMDPLAATAGYDTPFVSSGWRAEHLPDFRARGNDDHVDDWFYWRQKKSVTAEEFCILRLLYDPREFETERDTVWDDVGERLDKRVARSLRYIESKSIGEGSPDRKLDDWITWSEAQHWWVPLYMFAEAPPGADSKMATKAVSSVQIKNAFRITKGIVGDKASDEWWDERMTNANRYKLSECRAQKGGGGKRSLWYPDRIAGWLVDKDHFEASRVGKILRSSFPDCADAADMIDPPA